MNYVYRWFTIKEQILVSESAELRHFEERQYVGRIFLCFLSQEKTIDVNNIE